MGNISGRILLFVTLAFIVGYLIWYYRVGERRMVYEALACLSGVQRRYLSEKPHYILLNEADKERLIQKKNKRLLKMIILLAAAVSFAALSSWRHGIVLAVLVIGCALYIVLKSRYEGGALRCGLWGEGGMHFRHTPCARERKISLYL